MSEAPTAPDPAPDNRLSRTLKRYKGKLRRRPSKPRCKVCMFERGESGGDTLPQRLTDGCWHLDTSSPPSCLSCAAILELLAQATGDGCFYGYHSINVHTQDAQEPSLNVPFSAVEHQNFQPPRYPEIAKRHVKFELFYSPSESSQMLMAEECEQRYPALKARDHCRATNGDAIALANVCLQRCLAHHTQVCGVTDPEFIPTRLLSIGNSNSQTISLVDNVPPSEQYATLSHRWSEETSQISLLQHNLHERLSTGIALSALPIMFRDVVHILRQVGFKYVWIDCLCMIQDSDNDEDWRYEATRIGAVYQNSTLTVLMAQ